MTIVKVVKNTFGATCACIIDSFTFTMGRFPSPGKLFAGMAPVKVFKDVCGAVCACITYSLILYADYVITCRVLWPWKTKVTLAGFLAGQAELAGILSFVFHVLLFNFFCFMAVWSHVRTMLSDPGYIPTALEMKSTPYALELTSFSEDQQPGPGKCRTCKTPKTDSIHHCSVCRRCVKYMDHHCPWVNNCVARKNQKFFILFLLYIGIISAMACYYLVHFMMVCSPSLGPRTPSSFGRHPARGYMRPPRVVRAMEHMETMVNDVTANSFAETATAATVKPPTCAWVGSHDDLTIIFVITVAMEAFMFGSFVSIMMTDQISSILKGITYIDRLKKKSQAPKLRSKFQQLATVFGGTEFSTAWLIPLEPKKVKDDDYDYQIV
jgi:hypothetical protein